jgi:hypothetical protein
MEKAVAQLENLCSYSVKSNNFFKGADIVPKLLLAAPATEVKVGNPTRN